MDEEITGIKISEFPNAPSINSSDVVTGLHEGDNANFTFSRIMAWFREAVTEFFVPTSREINGQALTGNVTLTAEDVGAADEEVIATLETDMSHQAQHVYAPGQLMILPGGILYKATTAISVGDTLSQGTNIERVTVSDRIMEVEREIPNSPDDIGAASESIVAQKESSATSAHAYATGNYLILGGILYKVTAPIAIGDTIAVGTNVESVTIGGELEEVKGDIPTQPSDISAQDEILVSGILKGDGAGGISAATPGTDYGTYSKPSGGIPSADMASAVQTSLGKADTAYQKPSGGIPASDLASGVIPTVPSAYTSNPQMDGTASPGSTGNWADGGHIHPTDTTRVPTSRTINGYDLTQDRSLTAADVGALGVNGTAVAAGKLSQAHSITASSTGWYKVFELTLSTYSNTRNILLLASDSYIRPLNFINLFFQKTSSEDMSFRCDIPSITTYGSAFTRFKYTLSGNTGALWWHKTSANDRLVLRVLSAINGDGTEADIGSCWQNTYSASEPSGALEPWSNNNIKFENVPVNAGTNQEILRITSNRITANMEPIRIEFANSDQIISTLTWNSDAGVFTLTGTCTAATTANVLLGWNAV